MSVSVRLATLEDAEALLAIYAPYVTDTAVTFDYEVPDLEAFKKRMIQIMAFYPYLVAEEAGSILGYAYASAFHARAAYAWSAEVTIYLAMENKGKGFGTKLYQALERYLTKMGILNCNACIASTACESPYLANHSQLFHEKMGYQLVGKFQQVGYKFDQWFDMIWMEKMLGDHNLAITKPKSIQELLVNDKNNC
ncbi:GNAT family N-acetyltransferase [Streptococcus dysgalactiae]|uniref:GNAT family N-acetyltransferase n=1 Tax=Streptococcus dysgalactiae TaxID=1334 RepID=UPI00066AA6A3|nr:GNAT family N-acetyltransferase [Streptococcus dysgalactiae]